MPIQFPPIAIIHDMEAIRSSCRVRGKINFLRRFILVEESERFTREPLMESFLRQQSSPCYKCQEISLLNIAYKFQVITKARIHEMILNCNRFRWHDIIGVNV